MQTPTDLHAIQNLGQFLKGDGQADLDVILSAWPDCPLNGGDHTPETQRAAVRAWLTPDLLDAVMDGGTVPGDGVDEFFLDCPPLPDGVRIDPSIGEGAGGWVDEYVSYAVKRSPMTPPMFHQSAALWLPSVGIARRLVLPMPFGKVYPNLFVVWLAETTLFRKSTSLDIAREIADDAYRFLLCPQDVTTEALLSDLAGKEPAYLDTLSPQDREDWHLERNHAAQRGWVLDEGSGILASAGKDYNAGFLEALLRLYDCDRHYSRSTRGQGRTTIRNAYLTLLMASTPAAMAAHLASDRLWGMGWWARFAILTPETTPTWKEAQECEMPTGLISGLKRLYGMLPEAKWPNPPKELTVIFGDGVYDAWQRYNKCLSYDLLIGGEIDSRLFGAYGRLPVGVLKVSTILAALDWAVPLTSPKPKAPKIEMPHLARAMTICEGWRASAHRALGLAMTNQRGVLVSRVLSEIGRYGEEGVTIRDLYRKLGRKAFEVTNLVNELVDVGEIEAVDVAPGKKGGRKTTRYRVIQ